MQAGVVFKEDLPLMVAVLGVFKPWVSASLSQQQDMYNEQKSYKNKHSFYNKSAQSEGFYMCLMSEKEKMVAP